MFPGIWVSVCLSNACRFSPRRVASALHRIAYCVLMPFDVLYQAEKAASKMHNEDDGGAQQGPKACIL